MMKKALALVSLMLGVSMALVAGQAGQRVKELKISQDTLQRVNDFVANNQKRGPGKTAQDWMTLIQQYTGSGVGIAARKKAGEFVKTVIVKYKQASPEEKAAMREGVMNFLQSRFGNFPTMRSSVIPNYAKAFSGTIKVQVVGAPSQEVDETAEGIELGGPAAKSAIAQLKSAISLDKKVEILMSLNKEDFIAALNALDEAEKQALVDAINAGPDTAAKRAAAKIEAVEAVVNPKTITVAEFQGVMGRNIDQAAALYNMLSHEKQIEIINGISEAQANQLNNAVNKLKAEEASLFEEAPAKRGRAKRGAAEAAEGVEPLFGEEAAQLEAALAADVVIVENIKTLLSSSPVEAAARYESLSGVQQSKIISALNDQERDALSDAIKLYGNVTTQQKIEQEIAAKRSERSKRAVEQAEAGEEMYEVGGTLFGEGSVEV